MIPLHVLCCWMLWAVLLVLVMLGKGDARGGSLSALWRPGSSWLCAKVSGSLGVSGGEGGRAGWLTGTSTPPSLPLSFLPSTTTTATPLLHPRLSCISSSSSSSVPAQGAHVLVPHHHHHHPPQPAPAAFPSSLYFTHPDLLYNTDPFSPAEHFQQREEETCYLS